MVGEGVADGQRGGRVPGRAPLTPCFHPVRRATRGQVVEATDTQKSRLLTMALTLHRPQKERHPWAWRQRDKHSSAWLFCCPGDGETLSNEESSTTAALNLCLLPPCLAGHIEEPIRGQGCRVLVVKHGDSAQSNNIPRDHFHKIHSYMKMTLYNLCILQVGGPASRDGSAYL